ncbi:VOC family protein [Micromonospora sp. DT201]
MTGVPLPADMRTLGATAVDLGESSVPGTALADPEGNKFCLLAPG